MKLPTMTAMSYFDKQEDKDRIKDILSSAFKTRAGKDYNKKLYGYSS